MWRNNPKSVMKLYTSISDLQNQSKTWMQCPCKELVNINPLDVVNFYIAASYLINNRLSELSKSMDISGFEESEIVSFSPRSLHRLALGTCNKTTGRIQIAFKSILAYESLETILVHELCHLVHAGHTSRFWSFLEYNLKKLELISPEYNGWNAQFNKYDETWDVDFAYDEGLSTFNGSCDRRIAILKYKLFRKGPHDGLLLFSDEIYKCIPDFLRDYSMSSDRYRLYCNRLIIKIEV